MARKHGATSDLRADGVPRRESLTGRFRPRKCRCTCIHCEHGCHAICLNPGKCSH